MDDKTLETLEYPKILERIAAYASFAPTAEKAAALRPLSDLKEAHGVIKNSFNLFTYDPNLSCKDKWDDAYDRLRILLYSPNGRFV